jgi:hypothetical protein
VQNFGHSEVLIRMTDKTPLLLDLKEKFVTLNIYSIGKNSVHFPTREGYSAECVDLVAPDGLIFFTDGFICGCRAGRRRNFRESYALDSMLQSFNQKYMLFWRVQNIAFRRVLLTEQYQSALIVGLLFWPLALKPYAVSSRVALQCRVRLFWFLGHCVIHGNEEANVLSWTGSCSACVEPEPCLPLAP